MLERFLRFSAAIGGGIIYRYKILRGEEPMEYSPGLGQLDHLIRGRGLFNNPMQKQDGIIPSQEKTRPINHHPR